ncbi:MAG TPA: hypothetical protein DCS73_03200 [Roseburia sp.]|nr:hypothetical protein [Roseburia sp.]
MRMHFLRFRGAKQGGKSSPHQRVRILLRKTRRKILSSPKGSDFASQNKEDWHDYKKCIGLYKRSQV